MKLAICLLAPVTAGLYLAVSRRNDTTRWGLPGGKVDPGESAQDALLRETQEETGLVLTDTARLVPLYSGACPGKGPEDTYWVTTYLWPEAVALDQLVPEEGLVARALCEGALTDPKTCPFARYNVEVFRALRQYDASL